MSTPFMRLNENMKIEIVGLDIFNKPDFRNKDFLNLVAIIGQARSGKSTLMNHLVGEDVFITSNSRHACTEGAWLSSIENMDTTSGEKCGLLFVDTEGRGNKSLNSEVKLLTPIVLLAKVVIFNVSVQIGEHDFLEKLQPFVHIANHIKLSDKPFKFGHLIIVIRDYRFEGTEQDLYNDFFQEEQNSNEDTEKRNKIREKIKSMFRSISVKIFRYSLADISNPTVELDELNKEIRDKVREPRIFGGTRLTPKNVSMFVEKIVDQQKTNGILQMESVVGQIQRKEVDEARDRFRDNLRAFAYKLVLPVSNIEEELTKEKDTLIKKFEEKTSKVDFESQYKNDAKKNLEAIFTEILLDMAARNFKANLTTSFNQIKLPFMKNQTLKNEMKKLKAEHFKTFDKNTKEVDPQVKRKEDIRKDLKLFCAQEEKKMLQRNAVAFNEKAWDIGVGAVTATVSIGLVVLLSPIIATAGGATTATAAGGATTATAVGGATTGAAAVGATTATAAGGATTATAAVGATTGAAAGGAITGSAAGGVTFTTTGTTVVRATAVIGGLLFAAVSKRQKTTEHTYRV